MLRAVWVKKNKNNHKTSLRTEAHLSKLKCGNDREDEPPEAEVETVSVGQTGVGLPLQQLQHRVHDDHDSPGSSIALHSFRKSRKQPPVNAKGKRK